jgi:Ser/Thr protein kinase RdoA (MazF antagonist)
MIVSDAPKFLAEDAARLAWELFGLDGAVSPLPSERDQNFLLSGADGPHAVLKIAHPAESWDVLDLQNRAMAHVRTHAPEVSVPRVLPARDGRAIAATTGEDGRPYFVRALEYVAGTPLAAVRPHFPELLRSLGERLGRMDAALATFTHPAMRRELHWDLRRTAELRPMLALVDDGRRRRLVDQILDRFTAEIEPRLRPLRTSVIHNDWNDHNVLARTRTDIAGVVDFGDLLWSHPVCDLAIAATTAIRCPSRRTIRRSPSSST